MSPIDGLGSAPVVSTEVSAVEVRTEDEARRSAMQNFRSMLGAAVIAMVPVSAADAQATHLVLPHPDGEQMVDVSKISLETQAQILDNLKECFEEGFDYADENQNGELDNLDEQEFFRYDQGECVDRAQIEFDTATIEAGTAEREIRIAELDKSIAESEASIAATRERISKLTEQAMQDIVNN